MLFIDFFSKTQIKKQYNIKKNYQVLSSLSLIDVGIYLRDGPISTDIGIVSLNPSKGTLWVRFTNENYFDSYGCVCLRKLSKFIRKRNGYFKYA